MGNTKKTVDQVWELIETKQLDKLASVVDGDCHFKMPGGEHRGLEAMRRMLEGYLTAFPDLRHRVKNEIESGDWIAVELDASGTHTGPMQTPQGTVPATGKKVVWESCDYIRVRNGKIVSWHVYHDQLPVLMALGLVPGA